MDLPAWLLCRQPTADEIHDTVEDPVEDSRTKPVSTLHRGSEIAGRYRLNRLIGEGGMGTVWAADDLLAGRRVALKFAKNPQSRMRPHQRLLREACAARALNHPNVVEIHDIITLRDGSVVLAMEFLQGESLADRLERDGTMPLSELAAILQQVVSAVGAAHAKGIVHRDLKPANIFLAEQPDGQIVVKVLDFGLAKLTAEAGSDLSDGRLTGTDICVGTPCYMSPEQIFCDPEIDRRADIWALGVVLYEAISGVLPTVGDSVGQVMKLIATRPIPPLELAAPAAPRDVAELVNRMLDRNRRVRPQDLQEVGAVLSKHTQTAARASRLVTLGGQQESTSVPPVARSCAKATPPSAGCPLRPRAPFTRNRWPSRALIATAACALMLLCTGWVRDADAHAEPRTAAHAEPRTAAHAEPLGGNPTLAASALQAMRVPY